jgi:hypothetical protein
VLAHLRKGETFAQLAAGFGVGVTTAWRYVNLCREALASMIQGAGGGLRTRCRAWRAGRAGSAQSR